MNLSLIDTDIWIDILRGEDTDPLIAATALHHQLVLVSANVAHYQRVVQVGYSLRLENWREA